MMCAKNNRESKIIMNFPGIDRSISEKTIEEGNRFVSRYYRNRMGKQIEYSFTVKVGN